MKNTNMIDSLIEAIQTDKKLLAEIEHKISKAKEEKRAIVERLRVSKNDTLVLLKYLDDKQKEKIDNLNLDLDTSSSRSPINKVAQKAFDIIQKAKDHKLSNGAWYETYVQSLSKDEEVVSYTTFNIKCRSLFNTQKLIREKSENSKSSKEDIISLNGRPVMGKNPIKK
ncbi:MAG: hypothetical protein N4A45_06300 [Flavobacteriales bacterium]|nr:hypothetical protein [Flavobacteriales bacterium]